MKKSVLFVIALLILGVTEASFAARPPDIPPTFKLKKIGSTQTADSNLASGGHDVAMVAVTCGGSACTVTLADAATPGLAGDYGADAVVQLEVGASANETTILDLTASPISFNDGIIVQDDGNVSGVTCYEFRSGN